MGQHTPGKGLYVSLVSAMTSMMSAHHDGVGQAHAHTPGVHLVTQYFAENNQVVFSRMQGDKLVADGAVSYQKIDADTGVVLLEKRVNAKGRVSAITRDSGGHIIGDTRGFIERVQDFFHPHM